MYYKLHDGVKKKRMAYAMKQADKVLKVKHDWSIFEHDCSTFRKVDGTYLLRKSVGSVQSIANLVS